MERGRRPSRSGRGRVNPSRLVARVSRGTAPSSARDRSLPAHGCPRFLRIPLCAFSRRDWAHAFGCGEWEKGSLGTVRRAVLVSWESGGKLSAWKPVCDGAERLLGGSGNFSSGGTSSSMFIPWRLSRSALSAASSVVNVEN